MSMRYHVFGINIRRRAITISARRRYVPEILLGIFNPNTIFKRCIFWTYSVLLAAARRKSTASSQDMAVLEAGGKLCEEDFSYWYSFSGTEGPEQKTHYSFFNRAKIQVLHIKISNNSSANGLVSQEAIHINDLNSRLPSVAPKILGSGDINGLSYLAVEGLPRCSNFDDIRALVFLRQLLLNKQCTLSEFTPWKTASEVSCQLPQAFANRQSWLDNSIDLCHRDSRSLVIKGAVTHGDFAPWNIHDRNGTPIAIDWEHCIPQGVAYWDWIHWIVQTRSLTTDLSAKSVLAILFDRVDHATEMLGINAEDSLNKNNLQIMVRAYLLTRICTTSNVNRKHSFDPTGKHTNISFWIQMLRELEHL